MSEVKRDASPGTPYTLLAADNGTLMDDYYDMVVELVELRLKAILANPHLKGREAILAGTRDAVRLFVKNEPHKLSKIRVNRYRLICVLSLIDQIIERILYTPQCKIEIMNWHGLPSAPGMGAQDDDYRVIFDRLLELSKFGGLADTDVSGWDWNVKRWMQIMDTARRLYLWRVTLDSDLAVLAMSTTEMAVTPVYCLSDGSLYECDIDGRQISGRLITSNGNSGIRVNLATLRGAPCLAMGDDCVESAFGRDPTTFYESLALTIETKITDRVEGTVFCSSRYLARGAAEPVNWDRTLFRYLSRRPRLSDYVQFAEEIRWIEPAMRKRVLGECLKVALANEGLTSAMAEEGRHGSS
jgi:hypothetical protein